MPCLNHPEITDVVRCDDCRNEFCKDCVVELGGKTLCVMCKDKAVRDFEHGGGEFADVKEGGLSPWEDRQRIGFISALGQTFKGVMFSPTRFFSSISPTEGKNDALGYGFIVATIFGIISLVTGTLLNMVILSQTAATPPGAEAAYSIGLGVGLVLVPIQVIIALYISSAIIHLGLLIVGGSKYGFTATFRTQCYAQSTNIFTIVPYIGPLVTLVWWLVVAIIGLREMHRTSTGKAVFAVLFPMILGFLAAIVLVIVIGFSIFGLNAKF